MVDHQNKTPVEDEKHTIDLVLCSVCYKKIYFCDKCLLGTKKDHLCLKCVQKCESGFKCSTIMCKACFHQTLFVQCCECYVFGYFEQGSKDYCDWCHGEVCPTCHETCLFTCHVCDSEVHKSCVQICEICDAKQCNNCIAICSKCEKKICDECLTKCDKCDSEICANCKIECDECKKQMCKHHYFNFNWKRICDDCMKRIQTSKKNCKKPIVKEVLKKMKVQQVVEKNMCLCTNEGQEPKHVCECGNVVCRDCSLNCKGCNDSGGCWAKDSQDGCMKRCQKCHHLYCKDCISKICTECDTIQCKYCKKGFSS